MIFWTKFELRVHFRDLEEPQIDEQNLAQKLEKAIELNTENGKERIRFESDSYNLNVGYSCPWFTHYRDIYLHHAKIFPHERIRHIISLMFVVSR